VRRVRGAVPAYGRQALRMRDHERGAGEDARASVLIGKLKVRSVKGANLRPSNKEG
jgi:hypothetical protein